MSISKTRSRRQNRGEPGEAEESLRRQIFMATGRNLPASSRGKGRRLSD